MAITAKTTRLHLAAIVTEALKKEDLEAVLVGGAVVSLYTNNRYESQDLDFISPDDHKQIAEVMKGLGFKQSGKNFTHPKTALFVEFPSGPIAIGNEIPVKPEGEIKYGKTTIRLLSPTQCVMDRLAAWYHWNDTESLEQALLVAEVQNISIRKVATWSKNEGEEEKYQRFLNALKGRKKKD